MMNLLRPKRSSLNLIVLEVTPQCNQHCIYCYNHWKRAGEVSSAGLNYSETLRTLKELFRQKLVRHLTISGGEPLLFDRVEELMLYGRMKGATVSVITNGQTNDPALFSRLIGIGVKLFEISIHAPVAEVHDKMTRKTGSWQLAQDTISTIIGLGGEVLPVIVVTKQNYHLVGQTLEFLYKKGFNRIMLNRYNIGGEGVNFPEKIVPNHREMNEAFSQANQIAKQLRIMVSSNVCTPHCVVNPSQYPAIVFTNCSVDLQQRPLTLNGQGELRFCNHSPVVLGNINQQPIDDIIRINQHKYEALPIPDYCSDCQLFSVCQGGCRAASEQVGLGFGTVDPIVFSDKERLN